MTARTNFSELRVIQLDKRMRSDFPELPAVVILGVIGALVVLLMGAPL